jgi:hypothetical protein
VDLTRVLWIGGPPAAGKTSVARRIAKRHGLRLYSADTRTWEHRDRALAAGSAAARRFETASPAERWEGASTPQLLAMSLHRERGAMVLADLRALPDAPLVVAEGSCLPAWAFSQGAADGSRAVWLMPSAAVQGARLAARGTAAGATRLYAALREVVAAEAVEHGMRTLVVDDATGAAAVTRTVETMLEPAIALGPRAHTAGERRALLREANAAVVAQVRGWATRPWADAEPGAVLCDAMCECGDPACEAGLRVAADVLAERPALAPGHG